MRLSRACQGCASSLHALAVQARGSGGGQRRPSRMQLIDDDDDPLLEEQMLERCLVCVRACTCVTPACRLRA